ncbi:MAG: L-rhamnose/proton symporter RhaT [Verrucomicrobiota bacterium]
MNPILGVFFHWLGGLASGSFYVPYKGVKRWSWETYWLVGGFFSWLIAPWFFAMLKTTDVLTVLMETPGHVWFYTYLFGLLWGFGGLTFGLTMRYLGMSLGMAVALGYCTVFGTLIPPLFKGEFATKLIDPINGRWVLAGLGVCILGIIITALAGHTKEGEMSEEDKLETVKEFNFKKGILVATFSGIMSACFAFGLSSGDFIRETTLKVDMVNSAKKEGKQVQRAFQPADAEVKALIEALKPLTLFDKEKDANLTGLTKMIEQPYVTERKIADLKEAQAQAKESFRARLILWTADLKKAPLEKLEADLSKERLKAVMAVPLLKAAIPALGKRVADYATRLAAVAGDAKKLTIVQEMSTLAEKETALAISEAGANLVAIHDKHSLWTGLPVLIVVLLGGFTTNFIWCVLLNWRNKTGYQYFTSKPGEKSPHAKAAAAGGEGAPNNNGAAVDGRHDKTPVPLLANYIFSALAGLTWYFQFFFYSMGETQMGQYKFSSWTLHMASIIIFSSIWGLALHEWKGASFKAKGLLFLGLVILVSSTFVVGYGNLLGSRM